MTTCKHEREDKSTCLLILNGVLGTLIFWSDKNLLAQSQKEQKQNQIFPVQSPNEFYKHESHSVITSIDISQVGGSFLSLDVLRPHLPKIIDMLAALVKFNNNYPLPELVVDWAKKSRTPQGCTGGRLLERAIRHVTDPDIAMYPLKDMKIFKTLDGKIGISLSSTIPASMRSEVYKGTTSFTEDGSLLCVECECQAGGRDNERKNCTHGQTKAVCLTKELTNGLSDDCLYELQAMINSGKVTWDLFDESSLKLLIGVSRTYNNSNRSINSPLHQLASDLFAVGTDRSKMKSRLPVNPKARCSITNLPHISIFTRAKQDFNLGANKAPSPNSVIDTDDGDTDDGDVNSSETINYQSIDVLLQHLEADHIECAGNLLYKKDLLKPMIVVILELNLAMAKSSHTVLM